jgi:phosphate transport system substrate-binding protein
MRGPSTSLAAVLVGVFLASCTGPSAPSVPSATTSTRAAILADFPMLDGSTSTHPLARLAACDLYGVQCVWSAPASDNVERTYVPDPAGAVPAKTSQAILAIQFTATHGSYVNLIDGKADVILVARAPSADELAEAGSKGVQLDVRPVALDAFVFLVNAANPVDNLPLSTLRDVYSGKVTTWKQAGVAMSDPSSPIHAYQRERNSGSQELMQSLVMQGATTIDAPDMIVLTMLGPFNAIGGSPVTGGGDAFGIGYSVYYYATVMFANQNIKLIGVDGVKPTSQTIRSRTYPLVADVYAVTRKDAAADSPGPRFRDWLLSPDGQGVVAKSGYVPLP